MKSERVFSTTYYLKILGEKLSNFKINETSIFNLLDIFKQN